MHAQQCRWVTLILLLAVSAPSPARELNNVRQLSQAAFAQLSQDLASVNALRTLSPGTTLNLLGFDIGAEVGLTKIENSQAWTSAGGGSTQVLTPRVSVHKGLLAGLDFGVSVGAPSGAGTTTLGGMLRYQVVEPGAIAPGATLRLSSNRTLGSPKVETRSLGADLVLAKPLLVVTPYIGVGTLRSESRAPDTTLAKVSTNRSRAFIGFDTRLAFSTFAVEAERIGQTTTVSSKLGFRF